MAFDHLEKGIKPFNNAKKFNRELFAKKISEIQQNIDKRIQDIDKAERQNDWKVLAEKKLKVGLGLLGSLAASALLMMPAFSMKSQTVADYNKNLAHNQRVFQQFNPNTPVTQDPNLPTDNDVRTELLK